MTCVFGECEELVPIPLKREELVSIPLTCEELVPIPLTCEELVPILTHEKSALISPEIITLSDSLLRPKSTLSVHR